MRINAYKTHAELIENVLELSGYDLDKLSSYIDIPVEKLQAVMRGEGHLSDSQKDVLVRFYRFCLGCDLFENQLHK